MANQKHLDVLKQGVGVWNQWREKHSEIQPDFDEANLEGANFEKANFGGANFRRAYLFKTRLDESNLSNANLQGTDLHGASLIGANLFHAALHRTYLYGANLDKANLTGADLVLADLSETSLNGTDLSQTTMWSTRLADVDLSHVKGLDVVVHEGPSTIGLDTIYRSKGNIPETFLHGIGVPKTFLAYLPFLLNQSVDYYTCFISYSSKDQMFAKRLHTDLQHQGVRCWFAPEDLKIGDHYHQRIDESIRLYDRLVLILSEQAIESAWVEREVVAACEKEDREQRPVLFPIRLDDSVMDTTKAWAADVRRRWHIGDFTCWKEHDRYKVAFERLLRDLKAETKGESNG